MSLNDSSFSQYKFYVGIRGGSLWEGASNDSEVMENVDFRTFGRWIFGTLGNEADIIV